MGNSLHKTKKEKQLEESKKLKKTERKKADWKDCVWLILSYWARTNGLDAISFEHLMSNIVMTTIQDFAVQHFCVELAENILSLNKLTPKQINDYARQKTIKLQTFITKKDILRLCDEIEPILEKDEILIKLNIQKNVDQKLIIFGDIRGDLFGLLNHFDSIRNNEANMNIIDKIHKYNDIYLFLGSYVSRGKYQTECICLLYCLKIMFPENIYLLRGFQECASLSRIYGFYDELKRCYPKTAGEKSGIYLWKRMSNTFNWMPFTCLINKKWFAVHGGLSPELTRLDILYHDKYKRPVIVPDMGLLCDLLWSDPASYISGWGEMDKGVSYVFGADVVCKWLKENDLDCIIRAHQVTEDGFEWFVNDKLVTLFSSPDYCGEFENDGAIMIVDCDLNFHFSVIKSATHKNV